jgi:hypothetical protein
MLRMLTFAVTMSERITVVVPDGTRDKLKEKAKEQGHTPSALSRKMLLDGLKGCDHLFHAVNVGGSGNGKAKCTKCGYMP